MNIKVKLICPPAKPDCLADARVVLADGDRDLLVISGIRIRQSSQGLYVGMPSATDEGGRYSLLIEFNRQLRRKIEDAVMAAFEEWLSKQLQSRREASS
jgi:DNA-binding cell septation regulator SpoVG